jgi:hypothetical protein
MFGKLESACYLGASGSSVGHLARSFPRLEKVLRKKDKYRMNLRSMVGLYVHFWKTNRLPPVLIKIQNVIDAIDVRTVYYSCISIV